MQYDNQSRNKTSRRNNTAVFGERHVPVQALLAGLFALIVAFALLLNRPAGYRQQQGPNPASMQSMQPRVESENPAFRLINNLKQSELWHLESATRVPPVIIRTFPRFIGKIEDAALKKKLFLHLMLPVALVAVEEVEQERERLLAVIDRIEIPFDRLVFEESDSDDGGGAQSPDWREYLSAAEIDFIRSLGGKYRTRQAVELVERVDGLPVSLILAQGAIESSWGSSRFVQEGNNVFGVWTWGEKGIVPREREEGKKHKVRAYDSILESTRSYLLTLNRLSVYEELRKRRRFTSNPLLLAEGLIGYSERGKQYVEDVVRIIRYNRLRRFDRFELAAQKQRLITASRQPGVHKN